jgi:pimeloyl-ACP methyl ester carboxylesterase
MIEESSEGHEESHEDHDEHGEHEEVYGRQSYIPDVGSDEREMEQIERDLKDGKRINYTKLEINKLEGKVKDALKRMPPGKPSRAKTLENYLGLLSDISRNATDTLFAGHETAHLNHETEHHLTEGDELIIYINGWQQQDKNSLRLLREAKKRGVPVYAFNNNYNKSFNEVGNELVDFIKHVTANTDRKVVLMGHSDGGKIAYNVAQRFGIDAHVDRVLLFDCDINNLHQDRFQKQPLYPMVAPFGAPQSAFVDHESGRQDALSRYARPAQVPVYQTIGSGFKDWSGGTSDGLVPLESAMLPTARQTKYDSDGSHFKYSGSNDAGNEEMLEQAVSTGWRGFNTKNADQGRDAWEWNDETSRPGTGGSNSHYKKSNEKSTKMSRTLKNDNWYSKAA